MLETYSGHLACLREAFAQPGFDEKDLKTTYFDVDTNYESYEDEDGSWKRRFLGYECTCKLKLEFAESAELLGNVLYAMAHLPFSPEFRPVYTIEDENAARKQLLADAFADAAEKARILTDAAGVTPGDMISIDYSKTQIDFVAAPVKNMLLSDGSASMPASGGSYDVDLEPDNIRAEDTVTIIWATP